MIRKDDSVIPILFISSIGSSSAAVAGFKSGANDYIRKDMDEAEFKARIEAALRQIGFRERSEKTIDISDGVYLDLVNRELVVDGEVILFSDESVVREQELLRDKRYSGASGLEQHVQRIVSLLG